ncbi:MAG: phosphopantetheine-binding protein, partial [Psychrosphaera sp.]|nr:phosphopantetheine-binding protein [Psychrosphaera sp.]
VSIRPHRGAAHNELTRFRYQVILEIEHTSTQDAITVDWLDWSQTPLTPEQLRQRLETQAPPVLGLRNVANTRLAHDNEIIKWMDNGEQNFDIFSENLGKQALTGLDPHAVWQLADVLAYDVELSWAQADPQGRFDVLFKKRGDKAAQTAKFQLPVLSAVLSAAATTPFTVKNWSQYANNPLQHQLSEKLEPQLREYLGQELPDYMAPAHFLFLDKLPLTPNGKVDRNALPNPDIQPTTQIIAPRNETEKRLAGLWSEVLKIEVNSIMANFFDLGGHSLLATRLASKVRDNFGINLPLKILFEHSLLKDLAQYIDLQQIIVTNDTLQDFEEEIEL